MKKPSLELEIEIMDFVFSGQCKDHNDALAAWDNNPWEAVSMYESAVYPDNIILPLAVPDGVRHHQDQLAVDSHFGIEMNYETCERAEEGEYEVEGNIIYINKFGRITNPEDLYDEDETDNEEL